ncbi:MAG: hypothetical protein K9L59_01830 [Desulfobacterales bacterium]|nr:hypothetical protein [Desulfobacterales bacterium]
MRKLLTKLAILATMLLGLPMLGVWLAGLPIDRYLAFPPEGRYVDHAPFSPAAFVLYALFIAAVAGALLWRGIRAARRAATRRPAGRFPWWGWAALFSAAVFWFLAWSRFSWFAPFQPHTFTPLWLSFILAVNALDVKLSGACLMTSRPGYFLSLFPASAGFWWFFEYLNRFVQNWFYSGSQYDAWTYFLLATMSFSTVLPAVLSTQRLLSRRPRITAGFADFCQVSPRRPKAAAAAMLLLAGAGLFFIGVFPNLLFPLLWISPLLILVSLRALAGESHVLSAIFAGDWRLVVTAAAAALVCGFFWEMWNIFSLAKWEYAVPFVHRFQVFEMPVLGYAGYLPFGLECATAGHLLDDVFSAFHRRDEAG